MYHTNVSALAWLHVIIDLDCVLQYSHRCTNTESNIYQIHEDFNRYIKTNDRVRYAEIWHLLKKIESFTQCFHVYYVILIYPHNFICFICLVASPRHVLYIQIYVCVCKTVHLCVCARARVCVYVIVSVCVCMCVL